jgi:hypothetical protein
MKKTRLLEIIREEISNTLEEKLLNEIPIYNVTDPTGFKKTLDNFKEKGVSKSKALNLLLTKLDDEGAVDTGQVSKDLGVDTATFNNAEIRKFLARPEDERFETKTGEELIDFTPYLEKSRKKRAKKAVTSKPKMEKPTATSEPKMEKPTASDSSIDDMNTVDSDLITQYNDIMSTFRKINKEEGREKAKEYMKSKQDIVKKYLQAKDEANKDLM